MGSSWRKEGDASGGGVCEKVCALWGTARNCMAAYLPASRSIFRGAAICCDFLFQQLVLFLCLLLILHLALLFVPDVLRRELVSRWCSRALISFLLLCTLPLQGVGGDDIPSQYVRRFVFPEEPLFLTGRPHTILHERPEEC